MKTQVKFKDIVGKTIFDIDTSDWRILISFTDGTFANLDIDGDEDGVDVRDSELSLINLPVSAVVQLEIASVEELKAATEQYRLERDKSIAESERREFERLKAKLEQS